MFVRRSVPLRLVLSGIFVSCRCAMSSSVSTSSTARTISVAQLCSGSNKFTNLVEIAKCAGWAKRDGAEMLFLPENFGLMDISSEQTLLKAEPPLSQEAKDNPSSVTQALRDAVTASAAGRSVVQLETNDEILSLLDGLKTIAQASDMWISGGGMAVSGAPPAENNESSKPRVYNTQVLVDNHGNLQSYYRKVHLFDVSIPGKVSLQESASTAAGTELVLCDTPIGRLGLTTCYDVRFPEMYMELVKLGAQIMTVPAAFTVPTGSAHWHILLRARAIESQCYVIAAAQFGTHNAKRESYGHSLVIDPWGKIVADAGGCDGPGTVSTEAAGSGADATTTSIITCDVDLELVATVRERMPVQKHREIATFHAQEKGSPD